jgi:hypothetical protein
MWHFAATLCHFHKNPASRKQHDEIEADFHMGQMMPITLWPDDSA